MPTLDSIDRFLSPADQAELWQDPGFNQYHTNYEPGHSGYQFGTLFNFDRAWPPATAPGRRSPSTWKRRKFRTTKTPGRSSKRSSTTGRHRSNTGDRHHLLDAQQRLAQPSLGSSTTTTMTKPAATSAPKKPTGTFTCSTPMTPDTVAVDNLTATPESGLEVEAKRLRPRPARCSTTRSASDVTVGSENVLRDVLTPKVPAPTGRHRRAITYFVELLLRRGGSVIDRNVYWRSTKPTSSIGPAPWGTPRPP